ncbi:hypothetical protein ACLKA7_003154 [Drosophila subpalustris]
MIFHCSNSFIHWNKKDERVKYFKFIALSLTHTVSGILMLIGVLKNIKFIYIPGLLLSFIMPIVVANTVFVYMLVIQIIFAILACRFICFIQLTQQQQQPQQQQQQQQQPQ